MMFHPEILIEDIERKGFHIIDNFLDNDTFLSLRTLAIEKYGQGLFEHAKIGSAQHAIQYENIRSDSIHWLSECDENPSIQTYLAHTKKIAQHLNQAFYLGLHSFELHFAAYQPGTFYKKHVDQFKKDQSRQISCVYYLNENWSDAFGGHLSLYDTSEQLLTTITPFGNRFVCFRSTLPHAVNNTLRIRYSITGWMKVRSLTTTIHHDYT